jgi:hypothetical protein
VNPDTLVDAVGGRFSAWAVGGDDEDLMPVEAEMLHHPKHRVGHAVDIREEGLCDDRNAHTKMVTSAAVGKVASGDTTRKVLVLIAANTRVLVRVFCALGRAVDMRIPRTAVAVTAAMVIGAVGCTNQVTGTATMSSTKPPLGLSEDGYGIVAGYPDAPVQIELYTEPQCTHCAELQATHGEDIKRHINLGDLAVTYRPLTFLDDPSTDHHSERVANALFLAVGAPEASDENNMASGPEFQTFVEDLWAHQEPGGPGPSDNQMAKMAQESGLPDDVAGRIGDGETADNIDMEEMAAYNYGALIGIDPITTGTPTVYDLGTQEKIDIQDNDWLTNLLSST